MIGTLRHRVTIQSVTLEPDSTGGQVETWDDFATVWAEVKPVTGREYFAARQVNAEVSHRVTIRYLEGIDPTMRVVHKGRNLEVRAILDEEERERYMVLLCMERVTQEVYDS